MRKVCKWKACEKYRQGSQKSYQTKRGSIGDEEMNKCCASQDGICRNTILFGTKCDGYKERCTLRPCYENLEKAVKGCQHILDKMFGTED